LVFSATKGFRHKSIDNGKPALLKIGAEKNWQVDTTEDAAVFTEANLKQYRVVLFLNTTGNVLNEAQQTAFEKYIQAGNGFVGIHAATDTEYDWPWYNGLVGAYFESHPRPQAALYSVINKKHPSVDFMTDTLRRMEEIYNFKSFKKELVNVLITVDENSYTGGKMPGYHPIAWYHNYDGGRAFYTEWGHHPEAFTEQLFLRHIAGAIKWALQE
jgi:type 1 glutamine amidotransferase